MFRLILIELKKIRRSRILWLLFLPLIILWLPSIFNAQNNLVTAAQQGISPGNNFFIQGSLGFTAFIYPASMVVCTVLLIQNERSGHGLLKMLALPVGRAALSIAKFIVLVLLAAAQMLMNIIVYYVSAAIASQISDTPLLLSPLMVFGSSALILAAALPMLAFFWLLAVLIPSPVFSIGAGLASIVPALLIAKTRHWFIYPMSYPFYVIVTDYTRLSTVFSFQEIQPLRLIVTAIALLAACLAGAGAGFGRYETR